MSRILVVGLCCVDVVLFVDKFPLEDSDTRIFERVYSLGGNAANNMTVLSQFENDCELFASLPVKDLVFNNLINKAKFSTERSIRRDDDECPVSTVIINRTSGSRTVLHYRGNLLEIKANEFQTVYTEILHQFSWIHFEGRNFDQIREMIEFIQMQKKNGATNAMISVELEKIRPYPFLEQLIPLADVIFVSKDFARNKGWNSMTNAIKNILLDAPNATVICPWGENGAAGCQGKFGEIIIQKAFQPKEIVDTLGAGDCFIGVSLYFLNKKAELKTVLKEACRIAGYKCGQKGLFNLI